MTYERHDPADATWRLHCDFCHAASDWAPRSPDSSPFPRQFEFWRCLAVSNFPNDDPPRGLARKTYHRHACPNCAAKLWNGIPLPTTT